MSFFSCNLKCLIFFFCLQIANAEEADLKELLEILDCFFDPEKKPVEPKRTFFANNNQRRRSGLNGRKPPIVDKGKKDKVESNNNTNTDSANQTESAQSQPEPQQQQVEVPAQ